MKQEKLILFEQVHVCLDSETGGQIVEQPPRC
jgi:hypothetical protein